MFQIKNKKQYFFLGQEIEEEDYLLCKLWKNKFKKLLLKNPNRPNFQLLINLLSVTIEEVEKECQN